MIEVGIAVHDSVLVADPAARRRVLDRVVAGGLDYVAVGDHISFHGGTGFDGLVAAGTVLATHDDLRVLLSVYQLPMRHPVLVARQLATLGQVAPGRLTFGVGVGGEDRSEVANCGVDPATRGRRTDESLEVLRALATGEPVDYKGEFFVLEDARILPPPQPAVPIVVGGNSAAAIRRTAKYADGWVGVFCSARRFGETRRAIVDAAAEWERAPDWFGLSVWCGFGADERSARAVLGERMERLYHLPGERFRHVAPAGTAQQVAEWLHRYVEAGAVSIALTPAAASVEAGIEAAAEVRRLLRTHAG